MPEDSDDNDFKKRTIIAQENSHRVAVKALRWTILINLPLCIATLFLAVYTYNISLSTKDSTNAAIAQNEITKANFIK